MSIVKDKVICIDHTGFQYTGDIYINGWYAVTSADTAELEITDVNGTPVIKGSSVITNERMIYGPSLASPTLIRNLRVDVWANISKVLIFIDRFGAD